MEESNGRARLGRILSWIGYLWGALFFASGILNAGGTPLGDILAFFGGSIWIPAALIFIGRGIKRRAQAEDEIAADEEDDDISATMSTPPIFSNPGPRQAPPPPPPPPLPPPRRVEPRPKVEPKPVVEAKSEQMPEFDMPPGSAERPRFEPSYEAKSSAEMIAEAKKRLSREDTREDS